jgi:glutathione peroxidase
MIPAKETPMPTLYDFTQTTLDGKPKPLADFKGKPVLVVNVASKCGLTPQYEGLQKLHETYGARGFEVLGFPCNQFMGQEPGTEKEIAEFCTLNYGVTFPMFAKLEVNGAARAPLFDWLTHEPTAPDGPGDVAWNFAKFLVGKDGKVIARFNPRVAPEAPELVAAIEKALG